jgi:hypothetical protein
MVLTNEVVIISIDVDGQYSAVSCCPSLLFGSFHENVAKLIHLFVLYLELDQEAVALLPPAIASVWQW